VETKEPTRHTSIVSLLKDDRGRVEPLISYTSHVRTSKWASEDFGGVTPDSRDSLSTDLLVAFVVDVSS